VAVRAAIDIDAYPDLDVFFAAWRRRANRRRDRRPVRGRLPLHPLDDTNLAYLCDRRCARAAVERGDDP
jgi:5-methyltetrahydropteroyltriglutamate--homocysteine methyltransferase